MHLNRIVLHDFKNISDADLSFSEKINCISGSNGAGKTNLMEAVYYLSMTKSCFSTPDNLICRFGCEEALFSGFYTMDDGREEKIGVKLAKGGKSVLRGGKPYERFSDHIGLLPVVMVSPYDASLVNEGGEERRRYLNALISQIDREYLRHLQSYNSLLLRRNKVLREGGSLAALTETITMQMAPHAAYIHEARRRLCEELLPVVATLYRDISGGGEEASMRYRSQLNETPFETLMEQGLERDMVLGFTHSGLQRDDIEFTLDGHPLRRCGSQGQQKSFLLALKTAQLFIMRERCTAKPILLLDDLFDKLDLDRVSNLIKLVSGAAFGQIFISDSNTSSGSFCH